VGHPALYFEDCPSPDHIDTPIIARSTSRREPEPSDRCGRAVERALRVQHSQKWPAPQPHEVRKSEGRSAWSQACPIGRDGRSLIAAESNTWHRAPPASASLRTQRTGDAAALDRPPRRRSALPMLIEIRADVVRRGRSKSRLTDVATPRSSGRDVISWPDQASPSPRG
jgi:hypothetical protein